MALECINIYIHKTQLIYQWNKKRHIGKIYNNDIQFTIKLMMHVKCRESLSYKPHCSLIQKDISWIILNSKKKKKTKKEVFSFLMEELINYFNRNRKETDIN